MPGCRSTRDFFTRFYTDPDLRSDEAITLFKSIGTAIEDLAAAMLIWRTLES